MLTQDKCTSFDLQLVNVGIGAEIQTSDVSVNSEQKKPFCWNRYQTTGV